MGMLETKNKKVNHCFTLLGSSYTPIGILTSSIGYVNTRCLGV